MNDFPFFTLHTQNKQQQWHHGFQPFSATEGLTIPRDVRKTPSHRINRDRAISGCFYTKTTK